METGLKTTMRFPTTAARALFLILFIAVRVVSEDAESSVPTDFTFTDDMSVYDTDFTYPPLPDETAPQHSWHDEFTVTDMYFSSDSTFLPSSFQTGSWWTEPSDLDVSTITHPATQLTKLDTTVISDSSSATSLTSGKATSTTIVTADSKTSSTNQDSFETDSKGFNVTAESTAETPTSATTVAFTTVGSQSSASTSEVASRITTLTPTHTSAATLSTPDLLSTVPTASVSRFCNVSRTSTYYTLCLECTLSHCNSGDVLDKTEECLRFYYKGFRNPSKGCKSICLHSYTERACCQGYWGANCDECPGGHQNPCNGHGECQSNNGTCLCQEGFTGTACELCKDKSKFGINCSQECSCVHGVCNSVALADGECSCDSGYKGNKCDIEIPECESMRCHSEDIQHWRCADVNGTATCICAVGYEFSQDINDCTAQNPCNQSSSLCGSNSHCVHTGPAQHECKCDDGHYGDGIVCLPIDPCQTNRGGCEETTECLYIGPNQSVCQCKAGYEKYIPKIGCSLINMCTRTSCHPNAICQTTDPLIVNCRCKVGYVGDGKVCYGNVLETIKDINNNNPRFRQDLVFAINLITKFYAEPLTKHGPFTLFVPNDRAFRDVIRENRGFDKFLYDEDRAVQILRQHILIGQFNLEDLQSYDTFYTLQGNAAKLQIRVAKDIFRYQLQGGSDRAKVIGRNFMASNGIVHIINNLLTLEPEITGDKTKTAMDLIKLEGTYNRLETLIASVGLSDVFTQPNITVFAPENGAWDALPRGTLDYLMKDEEGQEKLKVILKNHVFPGVFGVTVLINTPMIKSFANVDVKVSVSKLGQVLLDGKVAISQVNIPCSTGLYHHIEGIILPSHLDPVFPNMCAEVMTKDVKGTCVACYDHQNHCPQPTDIPTDNRTPCIYYVRRGGRLRTQSGCSQICKREVKVPKCCSGFYGIDCIPCPGGYKTPCSGRGQCSDGITGSGLCFCERDLMGPACEQCRQKDVFGPHCNETCTCLNGLCDDGPVGTGLCKKGSCHEGYQGDNCNQKLVPCHGSELICHAHAKCFLDDRNFSSCECEMGYEGDGNECKEIDPCLEGDNGGCHQQATCMKVGPGVKRCECISGWYGDGFYCTPKSPCQNDADCDVNAKCYDFEPGQYHCVCKMGYRGDGITCALFNLCVENNGGCHPKAICTPLKPGERNCTCPDNLAGDGFTCSGTIADEVMAHPNLTRLAALLKTVDKVNDILDSLGENLTLFAPSDPAMEAFMSHFASWNDTSYWQDEENVVWFFNFHTVDNQYSTDDVINFNGVLKRFSTMYDGFSLHVVNINNVPYIMVNHSEFVTLSQPPIPALNGYIHIIDKVLEPFLPDDQVPTLIDLLSSKSQYQLFYEAMQVTGVLDQVKDVDEYTFFVPTNDAIKQLNRTVNAEFIKYYIVPKLVFTPSIVDGDTFETLLGPQHRLMMSVSENTIQVNGVAITKSDILLDGGVMHEIGGVLHPVLNRCDFNTTEFQKSDCGDCINLNLTCPPEYFPLNPPRIIKYECTFLRYPDAGYSTLGCQQICVKDVIKLECCSGYFGPLCKECPVGAENPCSGNGKCYDGIQGNGTCSCDKGFSELDCSKCEDVNLAPPHCNVTFNSCGYRNGNCSVHAICSETSVGVHCRCPLGFVGDGYACQSQCDILGNGGCHPQAVCNFNDSNHSVQCTCKQGFHGNGTWCQQNIDPCAIDNGGCDSERAICTFTVPKVTDMFQDIASCECKEDFVGDGKLCSRDIMDAISRIPDLEYLYSWLQKNENVSGPNVTHVLSDHEERSTVFLPISTGWQSLDLTDLIVEGIVFRLPKVDNGNDDFIDDHLIGQLVSLSGKTINITVNDRKQFFANDVMIVQANIETFNGVLHLTEGPIVNSLEDARVSASRNKKSTDFTVVIICAVLAVVVLAAMIGAVIYVKKHHEGIFKIFKRSQSSSESNISFARLSAQEEEENDAFKSADNAKYINPIFDDPDLL